MAVAVAGLLGVGGLTALTAGIAAAAVPTFPDNVVVFPDRDFITIEGYQDHVGETGLVEVKRDGKVIGSAKGVAEAGDVAFEINHPGGYCWGAGTGLNVTPDIKAGDVATVTWSDGTSGDTTVSSATVTKDMVLSGSTLTVTGTIGSDVNPAQMEQRIINPDLVDTAVAKRDIRAVPGPLTAAPKGGYSSSLVASGGTFTATYEFDDAAVAAIAAKADLGERAMSWQVEDADGNRQGLTIAEFGEAGGPGMGGCPAGPADQAPPAGSYSAVRSASDKSQLAVAWTPATPVPGAADVTGYNIQAFAPADTAGLAKGYSARTGAGGTKATLTVDPAVADYTVEVRSLSGAKMGEPFTLSRTTPTAPSGDTTAPRLSVTPAPNADPAVAVPANQVTLASESGSDIYFTTDGSAAVTAGLPSDSAKLYTGPIPITAADTKVHAVAFDRAGNTDTAVGLYSPSTAPVPDLAAPATLAAVAGQGSAKLDWAAVTGATSYQVNVTPAPAAGQPASTTARTQTVTGLAAGTEYTFTVKASDGTRTSAASPEAKATPTVVLAKVTISSGRWKNADTRIQGTTDQPALTSSVVRFYRKSADGTFSTVYAGPGALTAAVAPATGSTFDARFRTAALTGTTNPGQIVAKLFDGTASTAKELGASAPFTLTNG
ncbi:MAG: chitobiase/beta-hexosaminidase C-terminal domain-containing protein [Friedmanniella sp.]